MARRERIALSENELAQLMVALEPAFDVVRVVDPARNAARVLKEDGVALMLKRFIRKVFMSGRAEAVLIDVNDATAKYVAEVYLSSWEEFCGRRIFLRGQSAMPLEKFRLDLQGTLAGVEARLTLTRGRGDRSVVYRTADP